MIELPALAANGIRTVAVCVHADLGPDLPTIGPDEVRIAKLPSNEDICVRKIIDSDDSNCHFHIEIGFESAMPKFGDPGTVDQVLSLPEPLRGIRRAATAWARFRVVRADIPEKGIIRVLSGVSLPSPSKSYELTISGCTVDVSGDGPIKELRWWPVSDSDMAIEMTAHCEMTINDQLLLDAVGILEEGMDQFVRMRRPSKEPI